ncbi:MAG: hypothetical protein GF315_06105 [candidate division Zixibacteria bacterium]|nr:hypothetical protein [candidate division Zixibacteria bacterium]
MDIYTRLQNLHKTSDLEKAPSSESGLIVDNLASALSGGIITNDMGSIIEVKSYLGDGESHGIFSSKILHQPDFKMFDVLFDLSAGQNPSPEQFIFVDTETTGLSGGAGTMAFLVGAGCWRNGCFEVSQFFCPDFDHEASMLSEFHSLLRNFKYLVTYNGKAFDIPLIENRSILNRIESTTSSLTHLDLLHPARQLYKPTHGDCSLTSLENAVLNFHRNNDIPGGMIPQAYFDFLQSRNPAVMKLALSHNRFDILSLAGLFFHSCSSRICRQDSIESCFSLGRLYLKRKDDTSARSYFQIVTDCESESEAYFDSCLHLGAILKRNAEWDKAYKIYIQALNRGGDPAVFAVEAAKIAEHRMKNYKLALELAEQSLSYARTNLQTHPSYTRIVQEIGHRRNRLQEKIGA